MINNFTKLFLVALGLGLGYGAQAATEPTTQPNLDYHPASGAAANTPSATLKLTNSDGTRYLVVVRLASATRVAPTDGVTYTPNLTYGNNTGTNRTTGTGNYVVYADVPPTAATFNKITVAGLAANSNYVVDVYAYNQDGGGTDYLQTNPSTVAFLALPTYTWNNTNSTTPQDFGTSSNWTPARTLSNTAGANANHILIFDGNTAASPAVQIARGFGGNQAQEQIFGQLYLVNNVSPSFYAPSTANQAGTLQIGNATTTGDDFVEEAGSTLTMTTGSNTNNRYIVLAMPTGTTASISGAIQNVLGTSVNIPQRFVAADAGGIRFKNGSVFTSTEVVGHPFGTTGTETLTGNNTTNEASGKAGAGSVVFEAGSTFVQSSGLDPFGNGTTAVTSFLSGSTYRYQGGTFSEAARTYGNLDFRTTYVTAGAFATTILNSLLVNGAIVVSLNNTGGVTIGGDINSGASAQLNFNPATAADVTLNGSSAVQTIGVAGVTAFGSNATLVLDNPLGVRLLRSIDIPKALRFTTRSGHLIASSTNYLSMPTSASVIGASRTSYVEGMMLRVSTGAGTYAASTSTGLFFPLGTPNGYGPLTLALTQTSASGAYQVEAIADRAPQYLLTAGPNQLQRVSGVRYYSSFSNATFTNGQISLGFVGIDQVDAPATLRIAQSASGRWVDLGGTVTGAQADGPSFLAGTITGTSTITSISDFSLATTNYDNSPGNNPLPVELSSFTAERRGADALLKWTTALEKNSAYFEVQRSRDGYEFQSIGQVQAQGNSTRAISYSFLDKAAAGTVYYRLRQVDLDGTATDSRIVVLGGTSELLVAAYPNPVQHELHLQLGEGPVQWRVLSLLGQPLRQGKALGQATLDLSTLPAGSYQLEVRSGTQRVIRSLIKTN